MNTLRPCARCGHPGVGSYCGRCGARFTRRGPGGGRAWWLLPTLLLGLMSAGLAFWMVRPAPHGRETWEIRHSERVHSSTDDRFEMWDGMTYRLSNGAMVTLRLDRRKRRFMIEHNGRSERLTRTTVIESPHAGGETLTLVRIGESTGDANAWFTIEREDGD